MLFIAIRLSHPLLAAAMLTLAALPSGVSVIASPANQTPTLHFPHRILLTDPVPDPHQPGIQWFAPTGHILRGSFLDYWNKYGGLAQFGYPLTEEFTELVGPDNKPIDVQYFERNRFEHHPENAGTPYEVLLGTLGLDFHPADAPAAPLPQPARYFEQTDHDLSSIFKSYWDTHGGLFVHGYPITEQFDEVNPLDHKKYTVQYFERSRFELHPENAGSPYEVLLGLLGTQLARQRGYYYGWYPRYGHAADFSWISGRMDFYESPTCDPPECGCHLFQYQEHGTRLQLDITSVFPIMTTELFHQLRIHAPFTVSGHLAKPGELYTKCDLDRSVPGYIVDWAQTNPAQ